MKKYEKIFNEFINFRKGWEGVFSPHPLYLTICYNLIAGAHEGGTIKDINDLMIIYDNLVINNEILDKENFYDYDFETLAKIWRITPQKYKTMKTNIFKNDCIYLLNFYRLIHTEKGTKSELTYCTKKIDTKNLLFDNELKFIGFFR